MKDTTRCRWGHPWTKANTYNKPYISKVTGERATYRECIMCRQDREPGVQRRMQADLLDMAVIREDWSEKTNCPIRDCGGLLVYDSDYNENKCLLRGHRPNAFMQSALIA